MIVRSTIIGLLLGCATTLLLMHYDPWVKYQAAHAFKTVFESSVGCRIECSVQALHFWKPALVLENVRVTPRSEQEQWYWTAKRLVVSCNWWHVCCYGTIDLHVVLEDSNTYSSVSHGVLAIQDHVNTLLFGTPSTIPMFTKSVIYKRAQLQLVDADNNLTLHSTWNSESKKIDNHFKSTIYWIDGVVKNNNNPYLQGLQGTVYLDMISHGQKVTYDIKTDCSIQLRTPAKDARVCHITANWEHNRGTLSVMSDDHTLSINPVTCVYDGATYILKAKGAVPVDLIGVPRCFNDMCSFDMDITKDTTGITAHGTFAWEPMRDVCVEGTWKWNQDQAHLDLTLHNQKPLHLMNHWYIKPGTTGCMLVYDQTRITGSYHGSLDNEYQEMCVQLAGDCTYKTGVGSLTGIFNNRPYTGSFVVHDTGCEGSIKYNDTEHNLCMLTADNNVISGSLHISALKELLAAVYGSEIQGDGAVRWTIADYTQLPLTIACKLDGTVRIPQTYNAINDAQGSLEWDPRAKKICVRDVRAALYKGTIICKQATLLYDDETYRPFFIHAPCIFNECLLNMHKDLFALVSGHMTYVYEDECARLLGLLTIDSSQLKENIFSETFAKRFLTTTGMMLPGSENPVLCDITIKTITPTQIKTAFLDTAATIDLHVTNTLANPEVAGTIALKSGSLLFPYKPLYITQGALYCVPENLYDPLIEFSAKNSIKNHTVSMHVTGSLSKPHVMLESWPPLTQEQIVSLLLVGSYQDSLNMVMPALVMNNITTLMFGENHASHSLTNKFAAFLDPFKRIRLVPSFTDQTGRGGLRGAIEIDVSDRVHAVIQKNFSLTEDTYFELGYLLSDDINVRLLRDERRDMGAEVEMRWKFGN